MSAAGATPALALSAPFVGPSADGVLPWAQLVREFGLERLWLGHSLCLDPLTAVSWAAGRGAGVPVGTGVSLIPGLHPVGTALSLRATASATGLPVLACFSAGDARTQEAFTGARWRSPLGATREFLHAVRGLLTGHQVRLAGQHVRLMTQLPGPDATGRVRLGMGVLRARSAAVAGEVADAMITWLVPAAQLRDELVPVARASAAEHGRPAPRVVATVHAALRRPGVDPLDSARRAVGAHVELPHYRDALERGGVRLGARRGSDALRAVVDAGAYTVGDPEDVARAVRRAGAAGADEVSLALDAPPGTTWRQLRSDWCAVVRALAPAPPDQLRQPAPVGGTR